ncbi:hypothetical protein DPMN_114905 [Dreissena polymorpha]|uniref:Uncharacterized protein n=1 Tax=Dreissena polymorpha TaxID=45954 RepID=A0A9D4QSX2_DREPO|nr:hypothetical protein DPMN_114905 [Dreissena polymorpha]
MNGKYGSTGLKLLQIDKDGMMKKARPSPAKTTRISRGIRFHTTTQRDLREL